MCVAVALEAHSFRCDRNMREFHFVGNKLQFLTCHLASCSHTIEPLNMYCLCSPFQCPANLLITYLGLFSFSRTLSIASLIWTCLPSTILWSSGPPEFFFEAVWDWIRALCKPLALLELRRFGRKKFFLHRAPYVLPRWRKLPEEFQRDCEPLLIACVSCVQNLLPYEHMRHLLEIISRTTSSSVDIFWIPPLLLVNFSLKVFDEIL